MAELKLPNGPQRTALQENLRAARSTETDHDPRWRVRIHLADNGAEIPPVWSLASIIADRAVRGIFNPEAPRVIALGLLSLLHPGRLLPLQADMHHACLAQLANMADLGDVQIVLPPPADDAAIVLHGAITAAHPQAIVTVIDFLAGLDGHPNTFFRRSQVWFPVLGGDASMDRLVAVEVSVSPNLKQDGNDEFLVQGLSRLDGDINQSFVTLLQKTRKLDPQPAGIWHTKIRFARGFQGRSCELALVLADRIARGREWPATGRLIASGCISDPDKGIVGDVEGCERKCELIRNSARKGDRVLLPVAWGQNMPPSFLGELLGNGASGILMEKLLP
ncbi:hypothetical protein [Chitinilyticum aquatile]|uniref:hypothetical protein n=1 Tax=Chitinilyticum aquatile TaxID=362520 RepID=UPI0012DF894D|nr:hypothetical protein [Chitinilyticum aquatile]